VSCNHLADQAFGCMLRNITLALQVASAILLLALIASWLAR
jgi:hypothetical protein